MTNEQREQLFKEIVELEEAIFEEKHGEKELKYIRDDIVNAKIEENESGGSLCWLKSSWISLPRFDKYLKNPRLDTVTGWLNFLDIQDMKIKTVHRGKFIEEYDWEDRFEVFREEIAG